MRESRRVGWAASTWIVSHSRSNVEASRVLEDGGKASVLGIAPQRAIRRYLDEGCGALRKAITPSHTVEKIDVVDRIRGTCHGQCTRHRPARPTRSRTTELPLAHLVSLETPAAAARRDGRPGAALGVAMPGFFVMALDSQVVNVALPSIRHDLGGGLSGLQWIVTGYTLMFSALILFAGTSLSASVSSAPTAPE
jgi:hypothetical protein